jgi:hypothetical protein
VSLTYVLTVAVIAVPVAMVVERYVVRRMVRVYRSYAKWRVDG